MTIKKCNGCNKEIDLSACNHQYGVLTTVSDNDKEGTKRQRRHLCETCLDAIDWRLHKRQVYIRSMELWNKEEKN